MLLEKMYVRCPVDHDMINPRDYLMGQITKIDSFADIVEVVFNDPFNYRAYYDNFPKTAPLSTSMVQRCQFFVGSIVLYEKEKYKVEDRMRDIRRQIQGLRRINFRTLLDIQPTKEMVIVTFLAVLELMKVGQVTVSQESNFGEIYMDAADA